MKNKKVLGVALGVVSVFVIGIVVAYAALSTTLNARFNSVTSQGLNWEVGFNQDYGTSNSYGTYTLNGIAGGSSDTTGRSCGQATVTSNSITVNALELSKPGDKCTYNMQIENNGSLNASLSSITAIKPTLDYGSGSCTTDGASMKCGNITYKMIEPMYGNDGPTLSQGTTISANNSKTVNLVVEYTGTATGEATRWSGGGFNFNFAQA